MGNNRCIFCELVTGTTRCHTVYDHDAVLAFMDIRPINPGHVLVIPKHHEPNLFDLGSESYLRVMGVARQLAQCIQRAFHPKRVGLLVAGFDVPHAHVHLVPMKDPYDITAGTILEKRSKKPADEELGAHALAIRQQVREHCREERR